ncbi:MAG: TonB-dependent receptor, partial [Pseudomonadales bacterium]|nr:TonB-dependent receptor [Pseudomonadales bacterium]
VNIITKKDFDGTKFSAFYTQDKDGDFDEVQFEGMFGTQTDSGHFTFAASYRDRGQLEQTERPKFLREGFERSGTGNPGDWLVPVRDATGAITDASPTTPGFQRGARMPDPGCGAYDGTGGRDVGVKDNWRSGDRTATNCRLHFGEFWNYMNPVKQTAVWTNFSHAFNDSLSNELDMYYTRLKTESRGSPQNPGGRTEEFPIVLGDHPGNPFRAMANRGNGPEPLFALDANADGIPDRGAMDVNGDGINDVILNADPFSNAGGGVPFNEDVDVVALRIYGKLGTKPTALNADGSNTGNATFDEQDFRITDTLTYVIPDSSWEVAFGGIYDRIERTFRQKNTSQAALVQGLQGQLKASPIDTTTSYWNPFSTQELNCVNRVCTQGTPTFPNTQSVMDAIDVTANDVLESIYQEWSLIATGDLFEWDAGTVGAAVGLQYRKTRWDVDLNAPQNQCDWHEGGCGFDYTASQKVNAAFFEVVAPLFRSDTFGYGEVQLAGRYEDYSGGIGNDFNPKIAGLWQPTQWLSVRGSWSSAFIAPTLEDLYEPEDCGLETASDPLTGDLSQSFRVACVAGNDELDPETADIWSLGFSLSLLEGDLTLGVDYVSFDFKDRIAQTTMNQLLSRDFANYLAAGNTPGDLADIAAWTAPGGGSDPAIQRDSTGVVTRVTTSLVNAQQMKHKAFDFYGTYTLSTDSFGTFGLNLAATLVDEYSYDLGFGIPPGDGVGRQNESVAEVPPIPEWRVTGTLNWFLGNHSALVRLRWTDEVDIDFNSAALQGAQIAINGTDVMDDMLYTDIQYSYTFDNLTGGDRATMVEVGGRNIFNEFPDPIFNLGGIETYLYDIRGATWYFRVTQDL